uniref:Uncharacterized protein n=1 Tax=Romanomermis culicivorax TaxID=13658 RepID=A0A915IV38_ROMCU
MINIHNHMVDLIDGQNKLANNLGDSFLPLNKVELCLVNVKNEASKSNNGNEFWKNENINTM